MDLIVHEEFKIKRIDLAWDGVPFTPSDVKAAVDANLLRSLVKRNTLVFTNSPYEEREDGVMGTFSCQLGSRQSARMISVLFRDAQVFTGKLQALVSERRFTIAGLDKSLKGIILNI